MSWYQGKQVSLLTQHGKLQWLAPALEPATGAQIVLVSHFDTDTLGTFSRKTPRYASQLETAKHKARIGMSLAGCNIGLASEGSFGNDPVSGLLPWNIELVVWLDTINQLELVGMAQGPAQVLQQTISSEAELLALAEQIGFPTQGLLLRPNHAHDPRIYKDCMDLSSLLTKFQQAKQQAEQQQVWLETDHRAFCCPSRQQRIQQAADDLAMKLRSHCPACDAPGFWCQQKLPGLPCEWCHQPTTAIQAERWACLKCNEQQLRPRHEREYADPAHCDFCNP